MPTRNPLVIGPLPSPNAQEVETFRQMCREYFGVELTPEEAFEQATHLIQFVYLVDEATRRQTAKTAAEAGGEGATP
jgi:hypothetical protein